MKREHSLGDSVLEASFSVHFCCRKGTEWRENPGCQYRPGTPFHSPTSPFGIISTSSSLTPRPAVAIGEFALDLHLFASRGGFKPLATSNNYLWVFSTRTLNAFAECGRAIHQEVRQYLQDVFSEDTSHPEVLKNNVALQREVLLPLKGIKTHLPMSIGDYTDFFAGINHAFNVGTMFRGPANALNNNYKHLPVGYHGRASSVVVSGTDIRRPRGQILPHPPTEPHIPTFKPAERLDIELELGAFLCKGNAKGDCVPVNEAENYIFGYVLLNDWSARDIQTWEYVPLGPFNAKNFGSSVSPWLVLADALEPFRCGGVVNETKLLPYLQESREDNGYDISLEVELITASGASTVLSHTNANNLIWSFPQMLAHHSSSGCPMNVGDLLGSGTISGTEAGSYGSLLEICQGGKVEISLNGGEKRRFLKDGDTIVIRGWCGDNENGLIGFGDCTGKILTALPV